MSATTHPARLTGLAYLGIITTGLFAEIAVRMRLVVDDDPAATVANLAEHGLWFRTGMLADVAMIALDVFVAVGLLTLLQHVDRPLAQLAAALRLIQAAVLGANLMNMTRAVQLASGGSSGDALGPSHQGLVLSSMEVHAMVYDLGLVFFGLSCLVLALLLHRSPAVPTGLGIGIGPAGAVYLVGSFAALCAPGWSSTVKPMYGLAFLAELAFALWLVIGGWAPTGHAHERRVTAA